MRGRADGTHANAVASADGIRAQGRLLPTGRLEAFSDGVFAIAITLLVLELHVPGRGEVLVRSLEHEWPRYLAYVVSFAFICPDAASECPESTRCTEVRLVPSHESSHGIRADPNCAHHDE